MPAGRLFALAILALLLASCGQMPAPVRFLAISNPPLPGTPPAIRLTTLPPVPGLKPEPPVVSVAEPEFVLVAEPVEQSPGDLMARIERILLAEKESTGETVILETVATETGPVTVYTVRAGDTLLGISRSLGVRSRDLAEINGLVKPYLLFEGQQLTIRQSANAQDQVVSGEPASDVALPEPVTAAIAAPEPKGDLQFIWPVTGPVVSGFGSKAGGLHNDGINIAAAAGTPVRAAEDGVVSYVGDEIGGYGNLVLLRHANGWVTAYAHNARNLVARGQMVLRGDVIASVGASGGVSRPQSHFELRQGTMAIDPFKHLVEG